jgi:hypothetical protein
MNQEQIMNQWRVLFPEKSLDESACKQAHEWGYHAVIIEKEAEVFPLKPIFKITPPASSPFSSDFLKDVPKGKSLLWESALFTADFRKELLDRALLPFELHLHEIERLLEISSKQTIYYRIPDQFSERFQERHLDLLLRRTDLSVIFVHSAVSGHPKRLDLPPHPLLARRHPRLLPIYHAAPLDSLEGEWKQHVPKPIEERFCLMVPEGLSEGSALASNVKGVAGQDPFLEDLLDTRLCYLQAIAQGEENPPPEELRLLADLLIAEMRYQQKKGVYGKQEQKRRLLIRALEKMRVPVPLSLTMD